MENCHEIGVAEESAFIGMRLQSPMGVNSTAFRVEGIYGDATQGRSARRVPTPGLIEGFPSGIWEGIGMMTRSPCYVGGLGIAEEA